MASTGAKMGKIREADERDMSDTTKKCPKLEKSATATFSIRGLPYRKQGV